MSTIKDSFKIWTEKFGEAWGACMICMVQGDLTIISLNHAVTASKTGALTGLAMIIASFVPWTNKWIGVFLTGIFTMIADYVTGWSSTLIQPIATGIGAMVICIIWERGIKKCQT